MARFNLGDADKYGGNNSGGGFLSLKNDKDVALVRFLYNTPDEAQGDTVHEVEIGGKKVQIFEKGPSFFDELSGALEHCDADPICSQLFEIERRGKAGDKKTVYKVWQTKDRPDDSKLEDFDVPEILGKVILDKSADDMEYFLETKSRKGVGSFPPEDSEDVPMRRRSSAREEREEEERPIRSARRRTPANSDADEVF